MQSLIVLILIAMAVAAPQSPLYKGKGSKLDWWQNSAFYQVYPRSFKDSDGDGIGDIKGIIQKLDYIEELGVGGTWISPIFTSPMVDFGYDISDFYGVDPLYGTMADLEELFRLANARGIKILLDFVPNHTSEECDWFKKSIKRIEPYTDYYVWHDGKRNASGHPIPPNNWNSVFAGSTWTWNDERKQFYFHNFNKEQPDLNFESPLVVQEMKNVLSFWIKKGAAGFRVDASDHLFEIEDFRDEPLTNLTDDPNSHDYTFHDFTRSMPKNFDMVYEWRELLDSLYSESGGYTKLLMTETYANFTIMRKYFQSDDGKRQGAHVPLNNLMIDKLTEYTNATGLKETIDQILAEVPAGKSVSWLTDNHDKQRIGSKMGEGRIDCYLALIMTLPGVAIIYQGEEIGMQEYRSGIFYNETFDPQAINLGVEGRWREKSRDPVRTPFQWDNSTWAGFSEGLTKPWLPVHPNYQEINLARQKVTNRSTFKFFRQLIEFRKNDTLLFGDYNSTVLGTNNVFAYSRSLKGDETYVVLLNVGSIEEIINVHDVVSGFGDNVEVVLPGSETAYEIGDILPTKAVYLHKHNVLILKSASNQPSSATNTSPIISFIATIISLNILRSIL